MTEKLKRVFNEENESYLYFNEDLQGKNVLIEEMILESDEGYQTMISVFHYNDMDAVQYILYWGDTLTAIQVYRIVTDIHMLYNENNLADFLQLMHDMSETSMSALMQSDEKNKAEIKERIIATFRGLEVHG